MRFTTLAFISVAAAAPTPQGFDLGALLGGGAGGGGLDLGALLGGLGGAGGGGLDLGALASQFLGGAGGKGGAGGLDLGALASQFLGGGDGPQGDAQTIIDQYNKIKTSVDATNDFAKNLTKSVPADVVAQLDKFTKQQVADLEEAAKAVKAMPGAIPLMSATGLQGPGGDLTVATQESLDNLKQAAFAISKIEGAKDAEIKNLKAMLEATKAFNAAVNDKLPSIAQTIAAGEAQKSVDFLEDAIKAFENPMAPAAPAAAAASPAAAAPAMAGMGMSAPAMAAPAMAAPAMAAPAMAAPAMAAPAMAAPAMAAPAMAAPAMAAPAAPAAPAMAGMGMSM